MHGVGRYLTGTPYLSMESTGSKNMKLASVLVWINLAMNSDLAVCHGRGVAFDRSDYEHLKSPWRPTRERQIYSNGRNAAAVISLLSANRKTI